MSREDDLRVVTDAMPAAAVRCARDRSFLWVMDADRRRALESGFDHHLVKPVDPHALNRLLADLIASPGTT